MTSKFTTWLNLSLVGGGNLMNAMLGFFFLTALAKHMDVVSFGKYALITSILVSMSKLLDFGTNASFVSQQVKNASSEKLPAFYGVKFLLYIAAVIVSLSVLTYVNLLTLYTGMLFVLGLFLYGINYSLATFFQIQERFKFVIVLNAIPAIIKGFFGAFIFAGILQPTLGNSFTIFCLSLAPCSLLVTFVAKQFIQYTFDLRGAFQLIKHSATAGVSQFVYESWPAVTNMFAKTIQGFSEVGIFSYANKISNIFSLASISIFTVLLPKNSRAKKHKLSYDLAESVLISGVILILAVFAIGATRLFITRILGEKFADSIVLLDMLIFANAFTAIHTFLENYFFVEERTHFLLGISLLKLTTFIALATILTPTLKLSGIAYASLFSALISVVLTYSIIGYRTFRTRS